MSLRNLPGLSRRNFLAGVATTAAATSVPPLLRGAAADAQSLPGTTGAASPNAGAPLTLELEQIQGNVLAGFNKNHQAVLLFRFPDAASGGAWFTAIRPLVTDAATVETYRSALAAGTAGPATWHNVAVSAAGLRALGVGAVELQQFPLDFREGMAARASVIGDDGANAPSAWPTPFRAEPHALLLIGADLASDLDLAIDAQRRIATSTAVELLVVQRGSTRADEPGHEHFGFRDGISQPGIRGFTTPDPANPDRGLPGQDLLWPGEFVLGYPRQIGVGGGTAAGPIANGGPDWARNGSFLVLRRLTQDVAGFRAFVQSAASSQGVTETLMAAKLVGRYRSGAPLEVTGAQSSDPGLRDASLLRDDTINDFEYARDPNGSTVPLGSHIRKTYPRDEPTREGGEEDTQTHRIVRRGIPFGVSLPADAPVNAPAPQYPDDRGLLFLCYQTSIARQFEFIQRRWVNDPNFPRPGTGPDPVVSQTGGPAQVALPGSPSGHVELMRRFVTTTGGGYFFSPSIAAVARLGSLGVGAPPTTVPRTVAPTSVPPSVPPPTTGPGSRPPAGGRTANPPAPPSTVAPPPTRPVPAAGPGAAPKRGTAPRG